MAISAKDVMALRRKSGLGMMECKKALTEADGDMQKAEDMLRQKGLAKMDGRTDRQSCEGLIAVALRDDGAKAAIVQVNTETDFTAGTDAFKAMTATVAAEALAQEVGQVATTDAIQQAIDDVRLTTKENVQFDRGRVVGDGSGKVGAYVHHNGKVGALVELDGEAPRQLLTDLCMHVVAIVPTPLGISDQDVAPEIVAKESEIFKAQALESGKPEHIAEKMVAGKLRKFYEDNVLLKQKFVRDDKQQIKDILPDGVTIKSFVRMHLGQ